MTHSDCVTANGPTLSPRCSNPLTECRTSGQCTHERWEIYLSAELLLNVLPRAASPHRRSVVSWGVVHKEPINHEGRDHASADPVSGR